MKLIVAACIWAWVLWACDLGMAEIELEQLGTLINIDELADGVRVDEDLLELVVDSKYCG